MIALSIILYIYRCTNMDIVQKPSSTLSKDMKTYCFPLICCNCGTWFPSLGDIKFHFNVCKVSHRYFQCGHCALLFDNWHYFVAHINSKDMISAQPATNHFSWRNVQNGRIHCKTNILTFCMLLCNILAYIVLICSPL